MFILHACYSSEDLAITQANSGALSVTENLNGEILGMPDATGQVAISSAQLNYSVEVLFPSATQVLSISIFKELRNEIVEIKTEEAYYMDLELTTIEELLADFSINTSDLIIGDEILVYSVVNLRDGRKLRQAGNHIRLTIACSSDLVGRYMMEGIKNDSLSYSFVNYIGTHWSGSGYITSRIGDRVVIDCWSGCPRLHFTEECGEIRIPLQQLGAYSNRVYGEELGKGVSGAIDPNTGIIMLNYTIEFGNDNHKYSETLTPY